MSHMHGLFYGLLILSLIGCASSRETNHFVDPKYSATEASPLRMSVETRTLRLQAEYFKGGRLSPAETHVLRERVRLALQGIGVDVLSASAVDSQGASLRIVLRDMTAIQDAFAAGFGAALSTMPTDSKIVHGYAFSGTYTPAGSRHAVTHQYEHAIYTPLGDKAGPPALTQMSAPVAFDQVLKDLIAAFLADLQSQGYLVMTDGPVSIGRLATIAQ